MKNLHFNIYTLLLILVAFGSCNGQEKPMAPEAKVTEPLVYNFPPTPFDYSQQISTFVRRIFQDSKGNLWFGSNSVGVSRFDGDTLVYFSTTEGLAGNQVTGIIEDHLGNVWFSTNGGLSKYDGASFSNFTTENGLADNYVWSIYEDSRGNFWVGTLNGISFGNGKKFFPFPLPEPTVKIPYSRFSTKLARCITETQNGDMWFGTDGDGVYVFNGETFRHITTDDGLCDNNIVCIIQDSRGDMWFGSMFGGLSQYNGLVFRTFDTKSGEIGNDEVWNVFEDSKGRIWFASEGFGAYRYDGEYIVNFGEQRGLLSKAVQCIYEDNEGRIWAGGYQGLYLFDGVHEFRNVTKKGPWKIGC